MTQGSSALERTAAAGPIHCWNYWRLVTIVVAQVRQKLPRCQSRTWTSAACVAPDQPQLDSVRSRNGDAAIYFPSQNAPQKNAVCEKKLARGYRARTLNVTRAVTWVERDGGGAAIYFPLSAKLVRRMEPSRQSGGVRAAVRKVLDLDTRAATALASR